ncbi:RNA polymerase factor sigma-54 [Desulfopila inferna]|uniref:RNA polymerase factor sigma-54 n=1 Tax=Desulfopila inferna TaxID=468528 RepID=UPI001965F68F|nr:RNA polymerase factor sigma-54 [Desulfopila inferna]MBM9604087.1 RNA polymerase factor sigma-54 [Desulfopila inferna]
MALELRQQLKLVQKLVMTPQLRQAIKLLQLNRLELTQALRAEIEQNPALEEDIGAFDAGELAHGLSSTFETTEPGRESDFTERVSASDMPAETNWSDYANNFDTNFSFSRETPPADAPSQFDFISEKPGLSAYLQWQLAHCNLEPDEWDVARFIVGNLNRYGFLETDVETIIEKTDSDIDQVEYVLEVIQDLDPPGIGARDVSESLYLQLERKGMAKSLAATIVKNHLPLLQTKNYKALVKATGHKRSEIVRAIDYITSELTPFPGLPYSNDNTNYIVPDVYVRMIDGEYVIRLNDDDLPKLKLSSYYQDLLDSNDSLQKDSKNYINEKLKSAEWFIKSIQQRQKTIYRVMESLLRFQYDFFEHGPSRLRPLILRDVAEDIEMHESTISRVTSNKYVHTPQGIYELKYFFSTAIPREGGDSFAAESIRSRIRQMIQEEDKHKPLSDNAISEKLVAEFDIKIARRTVAKYREQLKILPVKHRRQSK